MDNVNYVPLVLKTNGLNVLVIGGGKVGTKRALKFKKYGANVTVFSIDFSEELLSKKEDINLVRYDASNITEEDLKKFDIIITATNDRVLNRKICNISKKLKILCNNPTDIESSRFIYPLFYNDGMIMIAVTTFGASSLVSKYILERVSELITKDHYMRTLLEVMSNVKIILKSRINDSEKRFILYRTIFNDHIFEKFIFEGAKDKALKRVEEILNEHSE